MFGEKSTLCNKLYSKKVDLLSRVGLFWRDYSTRLVVWWDGIGFKLELCSNLCRNATIIVTKCFFKHLDLSNRNDFHWTEMVQTILHHKFYCDWAYSHLWKSSDVNIALNNVENVCQTSYISKTVLLTVFFQSHWLGTIGIIVSCPFQK